MGMGALGQRDREPRYAAAAGRLIATLSAESDAATYGIALAEHLDLK